MNLLMSTYIHKCIFIEYVCTLQGKVIRTTKVTNTSKGYTGVKVFNEKPATVFNGTSPTESFLYLVVTDNGSE